MQSQAPKKKYTTFIQERSTCINQSQPTTACSFSSPDINEDIKRLANYILSSSYPKESGGRKTQKRRKGKS